MARRQPDIKKPEVTAPVAPQPQPEALATEARAEESVEAEASEDSSGPNKPDAEAQAAEAPAEARTTKPTRPLIEMGADAETVPVADAHDPQTVKPSPGWERVPQGAHNPDFDLEGQVAKGEDGGEYEFKKVVTKQLDGANVEKVLPIRKSDDKTLAMNEDVNAIDDWNERQFIIDKIEGIYVEQDGRAVCVVPGMWDVLNNYALGFIKDKDLPDHTGFREVARDYSTQMRRKAVYKVEMDIDIKRVFAEWFEACIWQGHIRKQQLKEEVAVGQINQKEFLTALHFIDMADEAMRKFQEGKIKL